MTTSPQNKNGKSSSTKSTAFSFTKRTNTIVLNDHPRSFKNFEDISDVPGPEYYDLAVRAGGIVSEVGNAKPYVAGGNNIMAFEMRRSKLNKIPSHIFGKMHLGDAFSIWAPQVIDVPAVGSSTVVVPTPSPQQIHMMKLYNYGRFDTCYLINLQEPLGANHFLGISAIELNSKNTIRELKWRPQVTPVIAAYIPYMNSYKVLGADEPIPPEYGSPCLKISCLNDNTTQGVSKPVKMTVWSCFTNLSFLMLRAAPSYVDLLTLATKPVENTPKPPPKEKPEIKKVVLQMEETGPTGPTATADAGAADPAEAVSVTPGASLESSSVGTIAPKPTTNKRKQVKGNQTGAHANKWAIWKKFTLKASEIGKTQEIIFMPSDLDKGKGESLTLPYRRNIFYTDDQTSGYTAGFAFKMISNRAPYMAGLIEIAEPEPGQQWMHVIGSTATEFTARPSFHSYYHIMEMPQVNSPWLKCKGQAAHRFYLTLRQLNMTDEKADITVSILVRPGNNTFQVPIKPKRKPKFIASASLPRTVEELSSADVLRICDDIRKVALQMEDESSVMSIADGFDPESIQVAGAEAPEEGEVENIGECEDLDQDSQWVCIGTFEAEVGKPFAIPLNLNESPDVFGNGVSPIAQKFSRFSTIVPQGRSDFGPTVGEYRIVAHLPATLVANIAHVALPADINEEAAGFIFGLENILSIAGSAISSVGGSVLNGAINTVSDIVNGLIHPGKIGDKSNQSEAPANLVGGIPISRFIDLLRIVTGKDGEAIVNQKSKFGSLLVQVMDILGASTYAGEKIPLRVLVRMASEPVTEIYDRKDVEEMSELIVNDIYLTPQQQVNFIESLVHGDQLPNAVKALSVFNFEGSVSVLQIQDANPTKEQINLLLHNLHAKLNA